MVEPGKPAASTPSAAFALRLTELREKFERSWRGGGRPRIEEFLPLVPADQREALLEGLLTRELELQNERDETVSLSDYRVRFADYAAVVNQVLAGQSGSGSASGKGKSQEAPSTGIGASGSTNAPLSAAEANTEDLTPRSKTGRRKQVVADGAKLTSFGDYEVLEEIARGGMGVVYKARQTKLNRTVAVKMILAGQFAAEEEIQRFYSEAEAAAKLDHPGIVPIYEVDEIEGRHFFSMAFIDGKSLQERIARGPLPQREAALLLQKIARAVHYAHEHGVVHRDLKPRNIMLTIDGEPKVTDFGLAKRVDGGTELTVSGQVLGTPGFMPPEQAQGKLGEIGPLSDVYSLGGILYCALTGRPPFQSANIVETLKQVIDTPPASPRLLNPGIDRDLETICLKCLEKAPGHRYSSAAELADELGRYLDGEPIRARRLGAVGRSWRWLKRRPLVAALAVSMVVLIAALGFAGWVGARALEARQVATLQQNIETGLDRVELQEGYLTRMEEWIAAFPERESATAEAARGRLNDSFAKEIRLVLRSPKLNSETIARVEQAIGWLEPRDKVAAQTLSAELVRRRQDWQEVFALAPPYAEVGTIWPKDWIAPSAENLSLASGKSYNRDLVPTQIPASGIVQLIATFAANWEQSDHVGVTLNAAGDTGYDFVLLVEAAPKGQATNLDGDAPATAPRQMNFEGFREAHLPFVALIRRQNRVIYRQEINADEIPSGPLLLRATRDRSDLVFQIGAKHTLRFFDPFPLAGKQAGVFGVIWPGNVSLLELVARRKERAAAASPLELGDDLFEQEQYVPALAAYEEQARDPDRPEFEAEATYKQGMCLMQLGRLDEAATCFEFVLNAAGTRWPQLAGCRLWVLRLRQKKFAQANGTFDLLSSRFEFHELNGSIPEDLSREIRQYYQSEFATVSNMMRYNPNLVENTRRMAAVDRFLSPDGRGNHYTQIDVARAFNLQGDVAAALQVAEPMARETNSSAMLRQYCRLLRLNGVPHKSLQAIDQFYHRRRQFTPDPDFDAELERARAYAALENWEQCGKTIDFLRENHGKYWKTPGQLVLVAIMHGAFLDRQGLRAEAEAAWSEGYQAMQNNVLGAESATTETIIAMVLGSLSGEMTDEDAHRFWALVIERGGDSAYLRQVQALTNPKTFAAALRNMWRTELGRELAHDYAFEKFNLRERVKVPATLASTEYMNQALFDGQASTPQLRVIFDSQSVGFDNLLWDGKLNLSQVAQLIFAWKGTTNFLGWGGVANSLDPHFRAGIAYVLGHRYWRLNDREQAVKFFEEAKQYGPEKSPLVQLAQADLELATELQGELTITNELGNSVVVILQREGLPDEELDVAQSVIERIPAGSLKLRLKDPTNDWQISPAEIQLPVLGRRGVLIHKKVAAKTPALDVESPDVPLVPAPDETSPMSAARSQPETEPVLKPKTENLALLADERIDESSGLMHCTQADDVLWLINDSDPKNRLFLVGLDGQTKAHWEIKLEGKPFTDWEDLAIVRHEGKPYLVIANIGDNREIREDLLLYLVPEPDIKQLPSDGAALQLVKSFPLAFEDGPRDCEALAFDEQRKVFLMVSKKLNEECGLYELAFDWSADKMLPAKEVAQLQAGIVTAMDISPDGKRLVLLSGRHAIEYQRELTESWSVACQRAPRRMELPNLPQPEAIGYSRDGRSLFLTSETEHQPLYRISLP